MRFFFIFIRWVLILNYYYENLLKKWVFKSRYRLAGSCVGCGSCCETVGIRMPVRYYDARWLRRWVIRFYEAVNDFEFLEYISEEEVLLFTCQHFDAQARRCKAYRNRPALCRSYPAVAYFDPPVLLPACGYRGELRK